MTPLQLDPVLHARSLDAARRFLDLKSERAHEPLWRPVMAAAVTALAALSLCAAVFSQGPAQGDPSSGPPGVRGMLPPP